MADYENLFADEDFVVEHLFTSPENHDLIQSFSVGNSAMGLEIFLKEVVEREESENEINVVFKKGIMRITPQWIVVELIPVSSDYTGEELSYFPDDYSITRMPSNVKRVEFELSGSLSAPGKLNVESIDLSSFKAYGEGGVLLERNVHYYVKFEGEPLTINKIEITVTSTSEEFVYNGDEHTANGKDDYWISSGDLYPGHRIEVTIIGSQTDIGSSENKIGLVRVYDQDGKDVTPYYKIYYNHGTLTVV
jgi:hypothetical protein